MAVEESGYFDGEISAGVVRCLEAYPEEIEGLGGMSLQTLAENTVAAFLALGCDSTAAYDPNQFDSLDQRLAYQRLLACEARRKRCELDTSGYPHRLRRLAEVAS